MGHVLEMKPHHNQLFLGDFKLLLTCWKFGEKNGSISLQNRIDAAHLFVLSSVLVVVECISTAIVTKFLI